MLPSFCPVGECPGASTIASGAAGVTKSPHCTSRKPASPAGRRVAGTPGSKALGAVPCFAHLPAVETAHPASPWPRCEQAVAANPPAGATTPNHRSPQHIPGSPLHTPHTAPAGGCCSTPAGPHHTPVEQLVESYQYAHEQLRTGGKEAARRLEEVGSEAFGKTCCV